MGGVAIAKRHLTFTAACSHTVRKHPPASACRGVPSARTSSLLVVLMTKPEAYWTKLQASNARVFLKETSRGNLLQLLLRLALRSSIFGFASSLFLPLLGVVHRQFSTATFLSPIPSKDSILGLCLGLVSASQYEIHPLSQALGCTATAGVLNATVLLFWLRFAFAAR